MSRFAIVKLVAGLSVLAHASPAPAPTSLSSQLTSTTEAVASTLPIALGGPNNIEKLQDVSGDEISAFLMPSYANFSNNAWNVRFYGMVYKVNPFDGLDTLPQNRTQDFASIPVPQANLTASISANGSTLTNSSGIQLGPADENGSFDQFVGVPELNKTVGETTVITTKILNVTGSANGTVILIPEQGLSVVSAIDDANSALFARWFKILPGVAFHYDTTTHVEVTSTYVENLFGNFPVGSLDTRPLNISEPRQILESREQSLVKLFQTFPQRKFVLIGDTNSSILLSAYPQVAQQFPNQVQCIFIQNTSATDPGDTLNEFHSLDSSRYFFYTTAEDLTNLDIPSGQCRNQSIPQNVTFGDTSASGALSFVPLANLIAMVWVAVGMTAGALSAL